MDTLAQYNTLVKTSPKLLDGKKLATFLMNYNPNANDVELYLETSILLKDTDYSFKPSHFVPIIMEKCWAVSDIEPNDEFVFKYFSQLFCMYLRDIDTSTNLVVVEIFESVFLGRIQQMVTAYKGVG